MKKSNVLKASVLIVSLAFFMSCKSTSKTATESNSSNSQATEMLSRMDTNKDGKLSKDEVRGPLQDMFDKLDTDSDGFLSPAELAKAPQRKGGQGGQEGGGRPEGPRN